jgi:hypothetical protein
MSGIPNERERSVLRPSRMTLFLRTFLPYQAYRFAWINLRMLKMIEKSHPRPDGKPK